MYWRQRAKTHWYRDGYLNTKFFHAVATYIKKVNKILSLETNEGIRITDDTGCDLLRRITLMSCLNDMKVFVLQ